MNTDLLLFLVACGTELGLGIAVLRKNPRGKAHWVFFLFLVAIALWTGSHFALRLLGDPSWRGALHALGGVALLCIPSLFLHFSLAFTQRSASRPRAITVLVYVPVMILLLAHGIGFSVSPSEAYPSVHDWGFIALAAWIVLGFVAGLSILARFVFLLKDRQQRLRGFLMLLAAGIPFLTAMWITVPAETPFPDSSSAMHVSILLGSALFAFALFGSPLNDGSSDEVASRVLQTVGDLLTMTTREGVVTFASDSFRRALGYEDEESLDGLSVRDFIGKADQILAIARDDPSGGSQPMYLETTYRRKNGETFPVLLSVVSLHAHGESHGLVFLAKDLTERQELTRKVAESREKYQQIVESSLDGIMIVQDGRLVFANPSAAVIFGYDSAAAMKGTEFSERVAPGSKPFVVAAGKGHLIGEDLFRNYEMKGLTRTGKTLDLEINARLVRWDGRAALLASVRDITERKELERQQALWFWEQEALSAIDRKLVAMVNLQQVLEAISHYARSLTRADFAGVIMVDSKAEQYLWRAVKGNRQPLPEAPLALTSVHRKLFGEEGLSVRNIKEDPRFTPDLFPVIAGEQLISVSGFPLKVDASLRGLLIVGFRSEHEFTSRETRLLGSLAEKSSIALANAELYQNLLEHEKELERLSEAREKAQEEERRRIARELHDGLGQMLTAIKFNVEILEDAVPETNGSRKKLREIKTLLDNVMEEAREISYNLMPSVLEDFGLVPALQLLCEQFSRTHGVKANFQSHGITGRLDPSLEVNIYRIAQEALNNIGKHAQARGVDVQLLRQGERIRLLIEDDGKGFRLGGPLRRSSERGGMGLVSMRQRVGTFGGTLDIDSTPGHGTQITVDIPLEKSDHHGKD